MDEKHFEVKITDDGKSVIITGYTGTATEVQIPPVIQGLPVTAIGVAAFRKKQLTSVIIPDGVVHVGVQTFAKNNLSRIVIPNSVTSIGTLAFTENQLTDVTIGADVKLERRNNHRVFDNGLDDVYEGNGSKAGIYAFAGDRWIHGKALVVNMVSSCIR